MSTKSPQQRPFAASAFHQNTPAIPFDRHVFIERFTLRPAILADVGATKNTSFMVAGTNMTSALCTYDEDFGGIKLTTAGADGDQAILAPQTTAGLSALAGHKFNTSYSPIFSALVKFGASVANATAWAGLKLTNTPVVATDNDQAFFRYEDDVNGGVITCVSSASGTDTETLAQTGHIPVAAEIMLLEIAIDANRIPRFYINGVCVGEHTDNAMTAAIDLLPFIGVDADGAAAAKSLLVASPFTLSALRY